MKSKKLYYAVSKHGQGVVFADERPEKDDKLGIWKGRIEGCYCSVISDMLAEELIELPNISFSDEPVELKLTINHV